MLYQSYVEKQATQIASHWSNSFWFNVACWFVIGLVYVNVFKRFYHFNAPTAIFMASLFILIAAQFLAAMLRVKKAYRPSEQGVFCGEHTFTLDDNGIGVTGNGYQSFHEWRLVKKLVRAEGVILIFFDSVYAYVFPEEKLDEPDNVYALLTEKMQKLVDTY